MKNLSTEEFYSRYQFFNHYFNYQYAVDVVLFQDGNKKPFYLYGGNMPDDQKAIKAAGNELR